MFDENPCSTMSKRKREITKFEFLGPAKLAILWVEYECRAGLCPSESLNTHHLFKPSEMAVFLLAISCVIYFVIHTELFFYGKIRIEFMLYIVPDFVELIHYTNFFCLVQHALSFIIGHFSIKESS